MAVGDVIRRLACKAALELMVSCSLCSLSQLGVCCLNGVEVIAHSLASILENLDFNSCILGVDFRNAFNQVSRSAMIDLVSYIILWYLGIYNLTSNPVRLFGGLVLNFGPWG